MGFLDTMFAPPDVDSLSKKEDVKGLIGAVKYKKDAAIRKAAVEALSGKFNFNSKVQLATLAVQLIGLQNIPPAERKGVVADNLALLVEHHPDKALAALAAALGDEDAGIRACAAEAIGKLWCNARKLKGSLGTFVRWFPPEEYANFERSVLAARTGTSFLNALLRVLQDRNDDVRAAAVSALREMREGAALPALSTMAQKDGNPIIRSAAASAVEAIESAMRYN